MSRIGFLRTCTATGLAAVSLAAGLALAPAANAAESVTAFRTDVAGDAQTGGLLSRNVPALDLLRVELTRDATSVTQTIRLAAVDPTRPDVHGIAFDVSHPDAEAWVTVGTRIQGGRAELTVDGNPTLTATPVVDTAAGTIRVSFPRAQVDQAILEARGTALTTDEPVLLRAAAEGRAPGLLGGTVVDQAGDDLRF